MYLSHLMINVGDNPDRPRPGRLWLRNLYHVHQRLSMAFPSREQRDGDPLFLSPFKPQRFEQARFLFRIDNAVESDSPRTIILVQSEARPDWDYAFRNASMFLAAAPETRAYNPSFQTGQKLRFRIRINLSKKSRSEKSKDGSVDLRKPKEGTDAQGRQRDQGRRVALTWEKGQRPDHVIREWFAAKGVRHGFTLGDFSLLALGWGTGWKNSDGQRLKNGDDQRLRYRSALLDGTLTVADETAFAEAVAKGVGHAKAFGFGLLSVAPLRCGIEGGTSQ